VIEEAVTASGDDDVTVDPFVQLVTVLPIFGRSVSCASA
jgi:hypothetical protein